MRPRAGVGWFAAGGSLLLAALLLVGLTVATGQAAYWVDTVPGGDAGLATSPELEAARRAADLFGLGLLVLGAIVGVVLLRAARRRDAPR